MIVWLPRAASLRAATTPVSRSGHKTAGWHYQSTWLRAGLTGLLAWMLWQIFVGANVWWQSVSLPEHGDKLAHALAFGGLYLVAALLVPPSWRRALLWATLALGAAHEISQIWQPDRTASFADWLADGAGAWLAGRCLRMPA